LITDFLSATLYYFLNIKLSEELSREKHFFFYPHPDPLPSRGEGKIEVAKGGLADKYLWGFSKVFSQGHRSAVPLGKRLFSRAGKGSQAEVRNQFFREKRKLRWPRGACRDMGSPNETWEPAIQSSWKWSRARKSPSATPQQRGRYGVFSE
jgi:hypothetical protein